jgi:hypothetical protein
MARSIAIKVEFKDEASKTAHASFNVPSGTTLANAGLAAKRGAQLMDGVSTAQVVGLTMSFAVPLPSGLKADPVDGSRVGTGALFKWLTSGGNDTKFIVPARKESIIVDGDDIVDEGDDDVTALVAEWTAGLDLTEVGGTGTVTPTDTRDEDIIDLSDGWETHGGKRIKR